MSVLLLFAALLAAPESVSPPPGPPPGTVIVNPDWVRKPTPAEVAQSYPRGAGLYGSNGRAVLQCAVAVSGRLEDCSVVEETPPEMGFGAAALELTEKMRMSPQTYDGVPVGGARIYLPLVFRAPDRPLPSLAESLACYGRLTAHQQAGDASSRMVEVAELARKRSIFVMKVGQIPAATRTKRLEGAVKAAKVSVGPDDKVDACLKAFTF